MSIATPDANAVLPGKAESETAARCPSSGLRCVSGRHGSCCEEPDFAACRVALAGRDKTTRQELGLPVKIPAALVKRRVVGSNPTEGFKQKVQLRGILRTDRFRGHIQGT